MHRILLLLVLVCSCVKVEERGNLVHDEYIGLWEVKEHREHESGVEGEGESLLLIQENSIDKRYLKLSGRINATALIDEQGELVITKTETEKNNVIFLWNFSSKKI